jgi:hypothetical protein
MDLYTYLTCYTRNHAQTMIPTSSITGPSPSTCTRSSEVTGLTTILGAIGRSDHQLSDHPFGKTIGLSDIGWGNQTIGLSDIELQHNVSYATPLFIYLYSSYPEPQSYLCAIFKKSRTVQYRNKGTPVWYRNATVPDWDAGCRNTDAQLGKILYSILAEIFLF